MLRCRLSVLASVYLLLILGLLISKKIFDLFSILGNIALHVQQLYQTWTKSQLS